MSASQYNPVPQYTPDPAQYPGSQPLETSSKSFIVAWVLSYLLGMLGIDRFYLGKIGTGILKLITLGGMGLWALIDLIMLLAGKTRDYQGLPLQGYQEHKKMAIIVTIIVFAILLVVSIVQSR